MIRSETPNKEKGRRGHKPEAIVFHMAEGNFKSAEGWIKKAESQVSYHYLISAKGGLAKFVEERDTAWHAGRKVRPKNERVKKWDNPNLHTIGIACAGFAEKGPTFKQVLVLTLLVDKICKRWELSIDNQNFIMHNEIRSDKSCPGRLFPTEVIQKLILLRRSNPAASASS